MKKVILFVFFAVLQSLCAKAQETESMGTYTDAQNVNYDCRRTYAGVDDDGSPQYAYEAIVIKSADAAGDVSIPASFVFGGNEYYVWAIDNGAFQRNDKLTSVQIPVSVRFMGTGSFTGCVNLTSVSIEALNINDSYYGVTRVSNYAFMDCYSLVSINLPECITEIEQDAFSGCTSLKSIFIPSSVKYIAGNVFQGCSSLTEVRVAEDNQVYDSRNNCNAIIETATNILMTGCANTVIPSSVETLGSYCFAGSGISSIEIPGTIKSIPIRAFRDCSALTSVTIHNGVETLGYSAFSGCVSLAEVTIPASVETIGNNAFSGCVSLAEVTIPASVNEIQGNPFSGCSALSSIVVDNANTVYDSRSGSNTIMETSTNTVVSGCNNSQIPGDATAIGVGAFSGIGFESFAIPEGIREIGSGAFLNCDNLIHLSIPSSVETIGTRFLGTCRKLEYVESYITEPCQLDDDAFSWYWNTYIPGYGPVINYRQKYPTVYIPKGTKEKYIAKGWGVEDGDGYKSNLIEMEDDTPTAITSIANKDEVCRYYDLNGRQLDTPHRGVNIVIDKDGKRKKIVF